MENRVTAFAPAYAEPTSRREWEIEDLNSMPPSTFEPQPSVYVCLSLTAQKQIFDEFGRGRERERRIRILRVLLFFLR
jgi:hypothetical protein